MTDVLVCIKRVPSSSGEVTLTADGMSVDGRYSGYTMSRHEECAVEIASQIASDTDGTVTVLSLGTEDSVEQLRSALSVGATDGVLLEADPNAHGPADIANAIASVVRSRAAEGREYGLVLLGNDAADTGDFQVGIRLAYALDRPVVVGMQQISVSGDAAELSGEGPDGTEVYEVALPAVVTILEGGVEPRYPSVMGRMKAKKAPIETLTPEAPAVGTGRVALTVPPPPASQVSILGEGASAAPAFVRTMRELGALR